MAQKRTPLATSRHHALHRQELRRPVDRIIFVVAIAQPLLTLPQVILIFTQHTAKGVSLATWVGYEIFTCVWFAYALVHKIKPIIMNEFIWFTLQGAVIIGILRYG